MAVSVTVNYESNRSGIYQNSRSEPLRYLDAEQNLQSELKLLTTPQLRASFAAGLLMKYKSRYPNVSHVLILGRALMGIDSDRRSLGFCIPSSGFLAVVDVPEAADFVLETLRAALGPSGLMLSCVLVSS